MKAFRAVNHQLALANRTSLLPELLLMVEKYLRAEGARIGEEAYWHRPNLTDCRNSTDKCDCGTYYDDVVAKASIPQPRSDPLRHFRLTEVRIQLASLSKSLHTSRVYSSC